MTGISAQLLVILLVAGVSASCGCWAYGGITRKTTFEDSDAVGARQSGEALKHFHELTTRLASDVSSHSQRLGEISRQLTAGEARDAQAIAGKVADLVCANGELQRQLLAAQANLQSQTRQVQQSASEDRTLPAPVRDDVHCLDDEVVRRVDECKQQERAVSAMLVNVDDFHSLNSRYGRQAGEKVLAGVTGTLRDSMGASDTLTHHGGEQFSAILPDNRLDDARQVAERARQRVEQTRFRFRGKTLSVTTSHGVAELLPDEEASALLKRADEALKAAKEAGRNCAHWHDGRKTHRVDARPYWPTYRQQPQQPDTPPTPIPEPDEEDATIVLDTQTDVLEELCNRTSFCLYVHREASICKRRDWALSVILVEVDDYDRIVSQYGQYEGELVLGATVNFLKSVVSGSDTLARYATSCFGLLLPGVALADATSLAEHVRRSHAKAMVPLFQENVRLTLSLGVAELDQHDDLIQLLERAEEAVRESRMTHSVSAR